MAPEGQLGAAGDAGAQLEAPDVEDVEGDLVALADLAQEVLLRDLRVLQGSGAGVDEPLMPVFFSSAPRLTPGIPFSMMKAVKCSPSTLAKVM